MADVIFKLRACRATGAPRDYYGGSVKRPSMLAVSNNWIKP
jgi:hypothetical protein